jgi:hypothetical protein
MEWPARMAVSAGRVSAGRVLDAGLVVAAAATMVGAVITAQYHATAGRRCTRGRNGFIEVPLLETGEVAKKYNQRPPASLHCSAAAVERPR